MGKTLMYAPNGFYSGFYRRLKRWVVADMSFVYVGYPISFCFVEADSGKPTFVVRAQWSIGLILRRSGLPKIVPTIVKWIKINMVYFSGGPLASHQEPRHAVRHVFGAIDANFDAWWKFSGRPGLPTCCSTVDMRANIRSPLPVENPGLGIVSQNGSDVFGSQIVASAFVGAYRIVSHATLRSLRGQGRIALRAHPARSFYAMGARV